MLALRPLVALRAGLPLWTLRSLDTLLALWPLVALRAGLPLWTLRPLDALVTLEATLTEAALLSHGSRTGRQDQDQGDCHC